MDPTDMGVDRERRPEGASVDDDPTREYPWLAERDQRFTLALVLDVAEVLTRHGYPAPTGTTLVDLTAGLHHALHGYRPASLY
jgi:hypothetical protein